MTEPGDEAGPLPITIFSDFSCPFSFFAESALGGIASRGVEVVTRAFELFPEPTGLPPPMFAPPERKAIDVLAAEAGIAFADVGFRPRTRKAHEAARFAREVGRDADLRRETFIAYLVHGRDIGRIDVLVDAAERAGIDPEELRIALDIDRHRDEVLHDQDVAARLGIRSTPTIFVGTGRSAKIVVGVPAPAELEHLIRQQMRNRPDEPSDG